MASTATRRRAFQIVILLTLAAFVVFLGKALSMVVVGWLPDDTLVSIFDTTAPIHRFHGLGIGWLFLIPFVGILLQLHAPKDRAAPMQQAVLSAVLIPLVAIVAGTFGFDGLLFLALVLTGAALHPRRRDLASLGRIDRGMALMSVAAALPWGVYAFDAIRLQQIDAVDDMHAALGHWGLMASLAVVLLATAFVGSGDRTGWRISAWTAGVVTVIFGIASIMFSDLASAASLAGAIAALLWGIGYLVLAERRHRRGRVGRLQGLEVAV